jgi:predicted aminopeptidase
MTPQYLKARFGADSRELSDYLAGEERAEQDIAFIQAAYARLQKLYEGAQADSEKLKEKARIMRQVQQAFEWPLPPNNATLIGVQLYGIGKDTFEELYASCGRSWPRFLNAAESAYPELFERPQREDFQQALRALINGGCQELSRPRRGRYRMH